METDNSYVPIWVQNGAENEVDDPDAIKVSDLDDFYSWCEEEGRTLSEEQKTCLVRFTMRWKARVNKYTHDSIRWGWELWKNIVIYEQNEERNEWIQRIRKIADRCLEVSPKDRSDGDIRKIKEYLKSVSTKDSKVLKLTSDELETLAKTVLVQDYKKGDILFLQGQAGVHYYVVISGKLDLFIEPNLEVVAQHLEDHASRNFESRVPDHFNISDFGTRKVSFYPGTGFGELAIELDEDGYANESGRSATVLFRERGRLLLVEKETYARTFMKYNADMKGINEIKNFFQWQQMFRNWGVAQLAQLASVTKRRTYTAGQVIKVQGNRVDEVFFIEHGSIDIVRTITMPNKHRAGISMMNDVTAAGSATIAKSIMENQARGGAGRKTGELPEGQISPTNTISIVVAQCGSGSMIGDTELIRGHEAFLETAVVPEHTANHCVILCLKRKIFERLVLKSKPSWGTYDMLAEAVQTKCKWRKQRLEAELGKLQKKKTLRMNEQSEQRSHGIVDRMAAVNIGKVTMPLSLFPSSSKSISAISPLRKTVGIFPNTASAAMRSDDIRNTTLGSIKAQREKATKIESKANMGERRQVDLAEIRDPGQEDSHVLSGVTSTEYSGFGVSSTVKGALGGQSPTKTHSQRSFQSQLRLPLGGGVSSEMGTIRLLGINSTSFSTKTPMPVNSPNKSQSMQSFDVAKETKLATSQALKQSTPSPEKALRALQALHGHHAEEFGESTKSAFRKTDPTTLDKYRWCASRGGPADPDPLRAKTANILDKDGRPVIESARDNPALAYDFESASNRYDIEQREAAARLTAPPKGSNYVWNPYALHQPQGTGMLRWAHISPSSREGTRMAPRSPPPRSPPIE